MILPRQGLNVCRSIAIARMVLATTTASAPACSAARATSGRSPVFGVSLTHSGSVVAARNWRTTVSVEAALMAKALPSSSILGQEILASIAATPAPRQFGGEPGKVLGGRRRDADDQRRLVLLVVGQGVVEEIRHAFGRNSDRIDQAAGALHHARQRIAGAQFARDGLGDESAEPVEVHHLVEAFGEGAGSRHHRIGERQAADAHGKVDHGSASIMSKTGPSQQTRR